MNMYVTNAVMLRHLMVDAKGVSQADVAKGTGISRHVISGVLKEKYVLNPHHIDKLANYFHVSPKVFNQPTEQV